MVIGISVAPMPRFDLTGATELLHGEADDDDPSSARTVVAGMLIADCASAKTRRHARTHDRTAHRDSLDARRGRAEMATHAFRLRPIMKQGTAAGIPETWTHYPSVEDAHAGAKLMYSK